MILKNKTYDILKLIALLILPLSELVAAVAHIWGLPYGAQIVATLVAIDAFLGAVLKISSDAYANRSGDPKEGNADDQ